MKIKKGTILIVPMMSEMQVGQKGYLTTDAILVVNGNKMFIAVGHSISDIKQGNYLIPIERTGPGSEDYEISPQIASPFLHSSLNKEEMQKIQETGNFIGPYNVETEIHRPLDYREQEYPRMDLTDLINEFSKRKEWLMDMPMDKKVLDDLKALRKLLKEKLSVLTLNNIQSFEMSFDPLSGEQSQDGEFFNYMEDKIMAEFVHRRIEELSTQADEFEKMSVNELEERKKAATENGNYELAAKIRDMINSKPAVKSE